MQFIVIFFSLIFGHNLNVDLHEFHLSKTTINYDSEEKAIQVSTRIFIDDLELSLKELGFDSLKICTRKEKKNAEQLIQDYINTHLKLTIDGVDLDFTFLGKEQSDDLAAVWCYLEAYDISKFKKISISNTILISQFDDQKNITMVQVDKEKIAHLLFTLENTLETVE
jgi:hypothetical protein